MHRLNILIKQFLQYYDMTCIDDPYLLIIIYNLLASSYLFISI